MHLSVGAQHVDIQHCGRGEREEKERGIKGALPRWLKGLLHYGPVGVLGKTGALLSSQQNTISTAAPECHIVGENKIKPQKKAVTKLSAALGGDEGVDRGASNRGTNVKYS